jgi:type IV secretion system protein VirB9
MKKSIKLSAISTLMAMSAFAVAENKPIELATTPYISNVAYEQSNVVPITGTPMTTTNIIFGKDETVVGASTGDLTSWEVSQADIPNILFVKPTRVGSNTNLTVYTNKHRYFFHIMSKDPKDSTPTYAVIFEYPQEEMAKINAKQKWLKGQNDANLSKPMQPKDYNYDYTFNGSRTIMPVNVFDDGTFTYFTFLPNTPQPAIFAVDNAEGNETVVNIRRLSNFTTPMGERGNVVKVLRVAPQFTLRLGKNKVASIFNKPSIAKIEATDS